VLHAHRFCLSDISPFSAWNICWLQVLRCSDYPHIFGVDPVTAAVWLVFFLLIVLIIFCRTMAYAARLSLVIILIFSLTISNALLISTSSCKFSKAANLFEISTQCLSISFSYFGVQSPQEIFAFVIYVLPYNRPWGGGDFLYIIVLPMTTLPLPCLLLPLLTLLGSSWSGLDLAPPLPCSTASANS
jgi:hypothetical protein